MEVLDIFAMREAGQVEDAYTAISEIYATHHGPHTSLCMFLCAYDMLKLKVKAGDGRTARRLLAVMVKAYPDFQDNDNRFAVMLSRSALAIDKLFDNFNLVYFKPWFDRMPDNCWEPYTVDGHLVPSLGQQIVNHLLKNIDRRDIDYITKVAGLFRKAVQMAPNYKLNLRHFAQMHALLGNSDQAVEAYKHLLRRYHDSYLYGELARLIDDKAQKMALYCQAIIRQPREEFRAKYHLELGLLLLAQGMKNRAAYEIGKCVEIRLRYNHPLTPFIERQRSRVAGVEPVSESDEKTLYDRSKPVVDALLAMH